MTGGAERQIFSATQEWVDAVSGYSNEYSEQRANLLRQGYKLFFETVLELPGLEELPSKHWSDYQGQEIDFVTHDLDREYPLSEQARRLRLRINEGFGFESYMPIMIGIFNVRDDKSEAPKGISNHSADIVVQSTHGGIFRPRVVLHLNYQYSDRNPDWYEKGIKISLFGIEGDKLRTVQQAGEMDGLLAANAAAALFAEEIRQTDLQTTS